MTWVSSKTALGSDFFGPRARPRESEFNRGRGTRDEDEDDDEVGSLKRAVWLKELRRLI